eukprot:scaffold110969_cov48-Phaeocystis_antarctica.AAC.1
MCRGGGGRRFKLQCGATSAEMASGARGGGMRTTGGETRRRDVGNEWTASGAPPVVRHPSGPARGGARNPLQTSSSHLSPGKRYGATAQSRKERSRCSSGPWRKTRGGGGDRKEIDAEIVTALEIVEQEASARNWWGPPVSFRKRMPAPARKPRRKPGPASEGDAD